MNLRAYNAPRLEDRVALLRKLLWDKNGGLRDPRVRKLGLEITRECRARDDMCELRAIFDFVVHNIRYTGDITGKDTFQSPLRTLEFRGGDCLPLSTLVMNDAYECVPIGNLAPGDRIWSGRAWRQVQESWVTGPKPILAFTLSNGCTLTCSPEHRLFSADGAEHRAETVHVGMELLQSTSIPTGEGLRWNGLTDRDFAWLTGLYVADGWWDKSRIAIAGRDGKPKEEQKRAVEKCMASAGINTRWHERYLAINDKRLAEHFSACGHRAPEKRLQSLAFSREQVSAVIEGLQADSGRAIRSGTLVHSTTSPVLALQLRVLYRMQGQSVHIRRVADHGGIGTHPIYRVTVRTQPKPLRVVAIAEQPEELCGDLNVDGHAFWLPESDAVVHNCDDHSILVAALAMANGFTPEWRITSNTGATWDHIYPVVMVPKMRPARGIPLDTTLGPHKFGVHPPQRKYRQFNVGNG